GGEKRPDRPPAMFTTPVTVPLKRPPTSIGTAHAGPITHSRKKNDVASRRMESVVSLTIAAGITNAPARRNPGTATPRRASLALRVFLRITSDSQPPTTSPNIPATSGIDPQSPSAATDRPRCSRRYVGYHVR